MAGERQTRESATDENQSGSARSRQAAARHEGGGEAEHPQDGTASTTWDTEEHSSAPGPFGTG